MRTKRYKLICIEVIFLILMLISGVYAVTNQTLTGALSTSSVDIELKIYTLDKDNKEIEYKEIEANDIFFPQSERIFMPKIYNAGEKCYLRVKIFYINDEINFMDYIEGFSDKFIKIGDYYYYDGILNPKETVKVFDKIKVPENAYSLTDNNKLEVNIIAEAMQVKNFTPDYESEHPWKNVEPTVNINQAYNVDQENQKIDIIYENKTEKDVKVPDSFLTKTKKTLPGDSYTEEIEIKNTKKEQVKYYVQIEVPGMEITTIKYLNKVNLVISNGERELYNGKFYNNDKIFLAELGPNEKENLRFDISVPAELSNEYANIIPKFQIKFLSNYKEKNQTTDNGTGSEQGSNGGSSSSSGSSSNNENPKIVVKSDTNNDGNTNNQNGNSSSKNNIISTIKEVVANPKTGDGIDKVFLTFLLSSIGLVASMVLDYRERKKLKIKKISTKEKKGARYYE